MGIAEPVRPDAAEEARLLQIIFEPGNEAEAGRAMRRLSHFSLPEETAKSILARIPGCDSEQLGRLGPVLDGTKNPALLGTYWKWVNDPGMKTIVRGWALARLLHTDQEGKYLAGVVGLLDRNSWLSESERVSLISELARFRKDEDPDTRRRLLSLAADRKEPPDLRRQALISFCRNLTKQEQDVLFGILLD
jgi:hypothetical protein